MPTFDLPSTTHPRASDRRVAHSTSRRHEPRPDGNAALERFTRRVERLHREYELLRACLACLEADFGTLTADSATLRADVATLTVEVSALKTAVEESTAQMKRLTLRSAGSGSRRHGHARRVRSRLALLERGIRDLERRLRPE